jgi:ABC-2 type transport system permease protein
MYHLKMTLGTTKRILQQLSHDHRTIGLMLIAPCLLISLLWWVFSDNEMMFDRIAPAMLGVFPFTVMFIVTSITTLRERVTGTMERLLAMPIGKFDIIIGYALAFGIFGVIQSLFTSSVAIFLLGMDVAGPQWFVVVVALIDTLLGVALGLLVSAFAKTEFQAVQFMPAFILPQVLICGLLVPLEKLPDILEKIAYALPLTYAVAALNRVTTEVDLSSEAWRDLAVVCGFVVVALVLGALTLRRRTA